MPPPETERPRKAKEPAAPPGQPSARAPEAPNQPAAPDAPPAVTVPAPAAPAAATVPEKADSNQAAPETTAPAPGTPPSNGTAAGASNWTTPVTRSAKATQVAAVTQVGGPRSDNPAPLPIIAGVLLLGAAGVAFAWWGRNRLRAH
ncbi:hypothetical protein [Pseudarthrobacter sp. NS4]|uniref:hypothetical protein n=1 Tax=Pseudarthrobacter sp. NS4 TaxID=2973976 RepID=UPI002162FBD6|nr:hypothetical protein [Pseudarthrobacter sp. NS4]